jgi:hypothetical protein
MEEQGLNIAPKMTLEETENAWFDAGHELQEVAIDWAIDHKDALVMSAEGGCVPSQKLLAALDLYFDTFTDLDEFETRQKFDEITAGMED